MPVLVENYNPAMYDNLKELEAVSKEVNEDEIRSILHVIRKQVLFAWICLFTQ